MVHIQVYFPVTNIYKFFTKWTPKPQALGTEQQTVLTVVCLVFSGKHNDPVISIPVFWSTYFMTFITSKSVCTALRG